jgi:hypothetical protein
LDQPAEITVDGSIFVRARGQISGNGTINVVGQVQNNGQIVGTAPNHVPQPPPSFRALNASPDAPASLVINGSYQQGPDGRLLVLAGGTNAADYGRIVITNSAALDGALTIRFINGFAPKAGARFDFLTAGGQLTGAFANISVENLNSDFQFDVAAANGQLSMIALNDGTFITPFQNQISSSNVMTVAGVSYLPYQFTLTNPCVRLEPDGPLVRQGEELVQTLRRHADPDCAGTDTGLLPLGALAPGNYRFRFMVDGVAVHTNDFTVMADKTEVLTCSRTESDELKLEIHGLEGVIYTLQSSGDLVNWFDLPIHPGVFRGPYTAFEPLPTGRSKFYRLKIE